MWDLKTSRGKSLRPWIAVVALATLATTSAARSDDRQARELLKAMSDYLAAQKSISFEYDSNLEVVTKDKQKSCWRVQELSA